MLPDLTPAASRALQAAQQRARQRGAVDVQPLHLLEGLLQEEEGWTAEFLNRNGLDAARIRQALEETVSAGAPHPAETPLPLHPALLEVLAHAGHFLGDLAVDRTIGSAQLFLALLDRTAETRRFLEPFGLTPQHLDRYLYLAERQALPADESLSQSDATERVDTARILDASANRAREALRVIEDYCRFTLNDPFLTSELKALRHDLREALALLPPRLLLEGRETQRDVGTAIATEQEHQRWSLLGVAQANLKRLQEALRSLEEFGKLLSPDLGRAVERLRYRGYTLERAIVLGSTARQQLAEARLYVLLTRSQCLAAVDWTIQEAAAGGATIFQMREKGLADRELLERARLVRKWTREAGVLFIMNDRPDIARLAEADGVHLGQDDMPVLEARRIVGPTALIGVSTHNLEQLRQAVREGASYVGVGPTFPSRTKGFAEFPGLEYVRQATAETSLPAFVIGGVNAQTIAAAVAAGARRVAVSQAICQAEEPRLATIDLLQALPGR